MEMSPLEKQVNQLACKLCEQDGLYLIQTELLGGKGNRLIRVIVDTEPGITLKETTLLTRQLNEELENQELLNENYRLEVTSPGLHRPLQFLWQYRRNVGRKLWVVYLEDGERNEFTGELIDVSPANIVLKSKTKEKNIPLEAIQTAKVQLQW